MNCDEARDLFDERLDDPRPDLDAHLDSCSGCRTRWSDFEAGHRLFREALRLPPPPPDLTRRVLEGLDRPSPWLTLLHWLRGGLVAATVAVWLVLGAALAWLALGPEAPSSGGLSPAVARAWERRPDPPRLQLTREGSP